MLKAKDIMTRDVITVRRDTPISQLSHLFIQHGINGVPVVDDDGKLVGIVTQGDLIEQNKNLHIPTVITLFDAVLFLESEKKFEDDVKKLTGTKVEDIYNKKVVTVTSETDIADITTIMAEKEIHTLPVVDDGKLTGVIGKLDLIKGMSQ